MQLNIGDEHGQSQLISARCEFGEAQALPCNSPGSLLASSRLKGTGLIRSWRTVAGLYRVEPSGMRQWNSSKRIFLQPPHPCQ
jgi:hypothetical protein